MRPVVRRSFGRTGGKNGGFVRCRGVDMAMLDGLERVDLDFMQQTLTLLINQRNIMREQGESVLQTTQLKDDGGDGGGGKEAETKGTRSTADPNYSITDRSTEDAYVRNMDLTDVSLSLLLRAAACTACAYSSPPAPSLSLGHIHGLPRCGSAASSRRKRW